VVEFDEKKLGWLRSQPVLDPFFLLSVDRPHVKPNN